MKVVIDGVEYIPRAEVPELTDERLKQCESLCFLGGIQRKRIEVTERKLICIDLETTGVESVIRHTPEVAVAEVARSADLVRGPKVMPPLAVRFARLSEPRALSLVVPTSITPADDRVSRVSIAESAAPLPQPYANPEWILNPWPTSLV